MDAAGAGKNVERVDYWQSEIPESIPRFRFGEYDEIGTCKFTDTECITYMLDYNGVTKEDIDAYGKALKDAGFFVTTTERYDDYCVTGMPKDRDYEPDGPDDDSFLYPSVSADFTPPEGSCVVHVSIKNPSEWQKPILYEHENVSASMNRTGGRFILHISKVPPLPRARGRGRGRGRSGQQTPF